MAEPRTREWPLIVFTVGLQLAAGMELATTLLFWRDSATSVPRTLTTSLFPITVVAIAASLFHLGKPGAAWRAFTNIGQSKLSREIVICSVFCGLGFAQLIANLLYGITPLVLTVATTLLGIAAVIASARIYTVPAQSLWNSGWVTSSFVGSMLLLGGVIASAAKDNFTFETMVVTGALVLLAAGIRMITKILAISKQSYAPSESLPIMQTKHWLSFCGLVLGTVIPIVALIVGYSSVPLAVGTAIIAIGGVVLGRALMYSRGSALARF